MSRRVVTLLLGSLLTSIGVACDPTLPPRDPAAVAVMVIHPQRGDALRVITLPGDVTGFYQATLYSKVTGYLRQINVDKGDWVRKGQVLADIEVPELADKLARERADLSVRKLAYQRLKQVWDSDHRLVARQDVDIAYGSYQESVAAVNELGTMLSYTRIIAPFDGVITGRFVDPGALIQSSGGEPSFELGGSTAHPKGNTTPVLSLAMLNKLRVYVYVPEEAVGLIRREMPATLTLKEYPGRIFRGEVARFATSLDLSTRTMLTEVDVENPSHQLYPGMYADVTLQLERHADALKVPPSAVTENGEHDEVFVVKQDRLLKVAITTGIRTGSYVEVTAGLDGDEQVVSNFTPALYEGEQVRTETLAPQRAQAASGDR